MKLFSKAEKSTDEIAKELERERQAAERQNADQDWQKRPKTRPFESQQLQEVAVAFNDFEASKVLYDQAMAEAKEAFQELLQEQKQYETSFWLLKALRIIRIYQIYSSKEPSKELLVGDLGLDLVIVSLS